MLCSVIARKSIIVLLVFFTDDSGPSGLFAMACRCGVILSSRNRKPIPRKKPTRTGTTAIFPMSLFISAAGRRSDHTLAATITPAAKPKSKRWTESFILFFIKKTQAEPSVVPKNGIESPNAIESISTSCPFILAEKTPGNTVFPSK